MSDTPTNDEGGPIKMPSRWDVTRAVRASDLPAPSRHIMLTLADVAAVKTCEIPPQFSPSLNVLADETGLNKSTIARHLKLLEGDGWIVRTRPSVEAQRRGERTQYRLAVPSGAEAVAVEDQDDAEVVADDDQIGAGVVAESNRGSRTEGQGAVAQKDKGSRRGRHKSRKSDLTDLSDLSDPSSSAIARRPDVEKVCEHLADRMVANGCNRPPITNRWRDSARLMLDRDDRTVDQIIKAIDWSTNDEFWRRNILSMPKLRERYEQLRLAARRASPQRQSQGFDPKQAMERALALEAQRS